MTVTQQTFLRDQLVDRKNRLLNAMAHTGTSENLSALLQEVNLALEKMANGTYGICETCRDSVEEERLLADPLARNCLDHLSPAEQRLLERDLDLAYEVQTNLLPKQNLSVGRWDTSFHYEPAGPVSGDYCDLIVPSGDQGLYFFLGDVSGKGVASSILMAQLHAIFRSLAKENIPVRQLVEKANQLFCESVVIGHFATLVAGRADSAGNVEICNAGHCLPLFVQGDHLQVLPSTGLPLGMFRTSEYSSTMLTMKNEATLVLYSDGVTEARNGMHWQYGEQRLREIVAKNSMLAPQDLVKLCVEDVKQFRNGSALSDDISVLVLRSIAR